MIQARLPLVLMLWSAGAAALALRLMLGLLWVRRRCDPARSRADALWQAKAAALAARLGIGRPVRVGLVGDIATPITAGWWRPVVLLPAALVSGMPPHLLEALLAHELAHIRRHDYLVNLLQSAIEIALFYHPAVWWLSRRIRDEREQVADDIAATLLGEPRRLAVALSELDRFQLTFDRSTHHPLAHAAHGGHLMQRITRLIGATPANSTSPSFGWKMLVPAFGLAAACATFYANAQSSMAPPPVPPVAPIAPVAPVVPLAPIAPVAPLPPVPPVPGVPPALRAPAVPPVPPVPPVPRTSNHSETTMSYRTGEPFALVRPGHAGINGSSSRDDWAQLEKAKRNLSGEFLWFRQNGQGYVVRDPATVGQVARAWAPVDKLSEEMQVYSGQMEQHGRKMEGLGRQMEQQARGANAPFEREMERLSAEQDRMGNQMNRLGQQMAGADTARRAQLQAQMQELGRRMGENGTQMGRQSAQMAARRQPMDTTGDAMKEAGKPMDALGKTMEALGKRIEAAAKVSEQETRLAIRDAVSKGLAQPAP